MVLHDPQRVGIGVLQDRADNFPAVRNDSGDGGGRLQRVDHFLGLIEILLIQLQATQVVHESQRGDIGIVRRVLDFPLAEDVREVLRQVVLVQLGVAQGPPALCSGIEN